MADSKKVALRENSDAHSFSVESDQDSEEIRRSWGFNIIKYGLSKFEGNDNYAGVAQYIYQLSLDGGLDDELGDVDGFGWYGRFAGLIKSKGPFYAICSEDSQGFFDVEWFDTLENLDSKWSQIEADYQTYMDESDE